MFSLYTTPFVDFSGVGAKIPAVFMNLVRTALPAAIDGAAGGTYSVAATIYVSGVHGIKADRLEIPASGILSVDASGNINVAGTMLLQSGSVLTATNSDWQLTGSCSVTDAATWALTGNYTYTSAAVALVAGTFGVLNTTITYGGTTAITYLSTVVQTDASTITRTGATILSGSDAVVHPRHVDIPTGALVAIDTSSDVWRLVDDPSNNQAITVVAPPLFASRSSFMRIYLALSGTTNVATIYQPDATTQICRLGGTLRWTDAASVSQKSSFVELEWSVGAAGWRIIGFGGAFSPSAGAL